MMPVLFLIFMFVFFQNSANNNDNDIDNNTNNKDRVCHDTNDSESSSEYINMIYLMMEVMCWHNHSTGLFVVVGWLEFVVVGFIDVGELVLVVVELMLFQE